LKDWAKTCPMYINLGANRDALLPRLCILEFL
jgi:hypothetical protein